MNKSKKNLAIVAATYALSTTIFANIFIETTYVEDPGNDADSTSYGAINYSYYIGTYEVTNSQYASFLNATATSPQDTRGLYNPNMGDSPFGGIERIGTTSYTYKVKDRFGNKAVNYVSFWDAVRFANWLTNGQGNGDTEDGVYTLTASRISGNTVTRNIGPDSAWERGGVAIASEDEWYKAAYYQPKASGGDTDSYWLYPTASNTTPSNDIALIATSNNANFYQSGHALESAQITDVGEYENSGSYYGTFDQGGNVQEWNDTIVNTRGRGLRGGGFLNIDALLKASLRSNSTPDNENLSIGFRIACRRKLTSTKSLSIKRVGNAWELRSVGAAGLTCNVERSTNLISWITVASDVIVSPENVITYVEDPIAESPTFYRLLFK